MSRPPFKIEREAAMTATFEDYQSARAHAWVTGSVACTYGDTEYRKEWDDVDHRIDCPAEACSRCQRTFARVYGDPPLADPVDRVARFLAYYGDGRPTSSPILTVAGASTDHKDVTLMVSDLRRLVDLARTREG